MKRRIALVVALLAAGGAFTIWRSQKTPRLGAVENPFAPLPIEVRFRDVKAGEVTVDRGPVTLRVPRHQDTYELGDDVRLYMPTPCGVNRLSQVYLMPDGDTFHVNVSHSYWVASVDNRGGPARTLRVGELAIPVAADRVVRQELFVEPCGDLRVKLDDEDVGLVARGGHGFLVDPTGKRCYRLREVKYGGVMLLPFAEPPQPKIERYDAKKLHPMTHIVEHMLERAPDKVETYTMKGMMPSTQRHEVLECEAADD